MRILENTDRWMIAFYPQGDSVSVMDKPTEDVYNFDREMCRRFLDMLDYVLKTRELPESTHYRLTLNESIDYVVNEMTKKGN